jgi:hypothetical protein
MFVTSQKYTCLHCDYFVWCISCTVVVLTCFVMYGCVYVWGLQCVGVFVICVFVLIVFCFFVLFYMV